MKHKITIVGVDKITEELFILISFKQKAKTLKLAINKVKQEIKNGHYDEYFDGQIEDCKIWVKPSREVLITDCCSKVETYGVKKHKLMFDNSISSIENYV